MAFKQDGYYYDHQLKQYVLQFMAIFSGLQVHVGKWNEREASLITVPIHYATPDRVTAAILADNTQNKPLRLPVMSAYVRNISLNPGMMVGTGVERRNAYVPVGGLVPDDIQVIHQRRAVPYQLEMELGIYVSNTDQHFQVLEQILTIFDPQLTIQTSDAIFDMKRLSKVELTNVTVDSNYPIGIDRRIIQSTLTFRMDIWFDIPAEIRNEYVNKILLRVGAVDSEAVTNFDIVASLDEQGIPYTTIKDGTNLEI